MTGSRAEYGLLYWLLRDLEVSPKFELQIVVTGAHLSRDHGFTYRTIEADGFEIHRKVDMLLSSDTPTGIAKSMGVELMGMADALNELKPDLLILLGDRYEILCAASAALIARIPIAHLHGGELTRGAIDESIRHAVTKMAHIHFTAAAEYQRRVVQMGEQPNTVFNVGSLCIDNIKKLDLLDKTTLEEALGIKLGRQYLLVTYHPATLESLSAEFQITELLSALEELDQGIRLVFTMPNADMGSRVIADMINDFVQSNLHRACVFISLGQLKYLSLMKHADAIIGNSSSGLTEAPSFRIGTVNIGDRQSGRLKAASVIDSKIERESIGEAIAKLYSDAFQESLTNVQNPYGDGETSQKILSILDSLKFDRLGMKEFHDIV